MIMNGDYMIYREGMESDSPDIMLKVLSERDAYDPDAYTASDVKAALANGSAGPEDLKILLSRAASEYLEDMAVRAKNETSRYFGNSVTVFIPLYISNYCSNDCEYCGFSRPNRISRGKLTYEEMEAEMQAVSEKNVREILILTGESKASDTEYICNAVKIAKRYFSAVGIETYPMNTGDYARIQKNGADFVSVYQETYDTDVYERVHRSGPKRCYPYRFGSQERALKAGMRGVAFGSLLGLGDMRKDAFAAAMHAYFVQRKYPHAEVSFSFPRIRPHAGGSGLYQTVTERDLLQIIAAYRIFMPFAGITISTRERQEFRDNVINIAATKISAGVSVGVGGYESEAKGDPQFSISDGRSVDDVIAAMNKRGIQPVFTDYVRLQ